MVTPKTIKIVVKCAKYTVVYEPKSRIVKIVDILEILSKMIENHNVS